MSNVIYDRLYALLARLVEDIDEQDKTNALLYAFARGLELMRSRLDLSRENAYLSTMSEDELNRYCAVFSVDRAKGVDEKRALLKEAFSCTFDEYNADEFVEYYESKGSGFDVSASNFAMTLSGLTAQNYSLVGEVMRRLEYYLPPCVSVKLVSDGLTFDEWDALDLQFSQADYMNAPFSVIETF